VVGVEAPRGVHVHIAGIDLVRDSRTGEYVVLEDNARTPSGVSYVLENRLVMTRTFPLFFQKYEVLPVDHYPTELLQILRSVSPRGGDRPTIVLLTPGIYNSAYFEHSFLAQQMGIELVEGRDLVVDADVVYMKTIRGLRRVDVIYRRIDDDFLDPLAFRPDSVLGVPGLIGAYRAHNVALVNAVGNGVADDKAVYAYVPTFIRYYLGEELILRNVETYLCTIPSSRLRHRAPLRAGREARRRVGRLRPAHGAHGRQGRPGAFRDRLRADPRNCRAAARRAVPRAVLGRGSRAWSERHVDLRPYRLYDGDRVTIVPGGLTRVAARGPMVNLPGRRQQDTWVLQGGA
jgi:uncharacterized circularly permuted ATP-grasp superfamily protein